MIRSIYDRLIKQLFSLKGKRAFLILTLFCTTFSLTAQAQTTVRGKITDETGKPLPAVSITVKGSTRGTTSDENGTFSISASPGDIIVVSSVGYLNKEITVGNENALNISLASTNSQLTDVIVIGYGTQKRTAVTGAITSVNSKTLNELPVASLSEALQ